MATTVPTSVSDRAAQAERIRSAIRLAAHEAVVMHYQRRHSHEVTSRMTAIVFKMLAKGRRFSPADRKMVLGWIRAAVDEKKSEMEAEPC